MNSVPANAKERFGDRVKDYVKYRPAYPREVIDWILACTPGLQAVADVGSGTGIFASLWLQQGLRVFGVEPNQAMRAAAEAQLGADPNFVSVAGSAERTGLPAESVGLVTCAQAFHWFNHDAARAEFTRILRPPGYVALVWNDRDVAGDDFATAYEHLLREHAPEYLQVVHRNVSAADLEAFFAPEQLETVDFKNAQTLDSDAFIGRTLSSSYVPNQGKPGHEGMMAALERTFATHQSGGVVRMRYLTRVYLGRLRGPVGTRVPSLACRGLR
ncbi:MAG TPA: class I SAM-dependent methyltransferase [Chthoniobacterales bacterium]